MNIPLPPSPIITPHHYSPLFPTSPHLTSSPHSPISFPPLSPIPITFPSIPLLLLSPLSPFPYPSPSPLPLLLCISPHLSSLSPHHPGSSTLSRPAHGLTTALIHQAHIRPPPQQSPHISGPRPSYFRPLSPYLNTSSNTRPFVHPAQNSLNFLYTLTT